MEQKNKTHWLNKYLICARWEHFWVLSICIKQEFPIPIPWTVVSILVSRELTFEYYDHQLLPSSNQLIWLHATISACDKTLADKAQSLGLYVMTQWQGFSHVSTPIKWIRTFFLDRCVDFCLLWLSIFSSFIKLHINFCQTINWLCKDLDVLLKVASSYLLSKFLQCIYLRFTCK